MNDISNIITMLLSDAEAVSFAILAGVLLFAISTVLIWWHGRQRTEIVNEVAESPSDIEVVIADLKSDAIRPSSPAELGNFGAPVLSTETEKQTAFEKEDCQTLEITRDLDPSDEPSRLPPEHAFSIEITEKEIDLNLSKIAPNFSVEPQEIQSGPTEVPLKRTTSIAQDKISIPKLGTEDTPENVSGSEANCDFDGETGKFNAEPNIASKLNTFSEPLGNEPINNQINENDYEINGSNSAEITPDAIANAVAELVGSGNGENAIIKSKGKLDNQKDLGSAELSFDKEETLNDNQKVFDEIEHLAEVEAKMRALRELFEAGLIAPEVYLLKAREYASEGL